MKRPDEAIFFGQGALRGKAAIAAGWKPYYEGPAAPCSWEPTSDTGGAP